MTIMKESSAGIQFHLREQEYTPLNKPLHAQIVCIITGADNKDEKRMQVMAERMPQVPLRNVDDAVIALSEWEG